ncbi:toll-like receptor 5 isoform X1 [Erpetoichthys calabaricus]|uniref:toll-like receptor 5 isoform X1 n=2 Tax=Erpetoichthys calabaricus TaxID=27687 RepID=UPI002234E1BC|nr:toll-like receptor 5 isoform X1 [Erpetoichthys calabaricus]
MLRKIMWFPFLLFLGAMVEPIRMFPCKVYQHVAYCSFKSLTEIPDFPNDIIEIDLSVNNITEITEYSFPKLSSLTVLDIGHQQTNFLTVRQNAFINVTNLQVLSLAGNVNLILSPDAFVGLFNVRYLNLLYNNLNESIVEEEYLRDLVSLETLDLYGNRIQRLRPNSCFRKMTNFKILNLKLNQITQICGDDLLHFRGKSLQLLNLDSNYVGNIESTPTFWEECGYPFQNINFEILNLAGNGLDEELMRRFVSSLRGSYIQGLILNHNSVGRSFGFNNSLDPGEETFDGLSQIPIIALDLSNCFIFSLEPYVFKPLHEMRVLQLSFNKINQIQRGAFEGLNNLQVLNLSNNLLGEILPNDFYGLQSITTIDLSNNNIGGIILTAFNKMPFLSELNLRGNSIRKFEIFATIPSLQYFLLGDNKLDSSFQLTDIATDSIFVDLSENRLSNLDVFFKMMADGKKKFILLRHNRLSYCKGSSNIPENNSLIHLDLEDNILELVWQRETCLHIFHKLGKLEKLRLNQNGLRSLPSDIFKGLISLTHLNLSSNFITYLPKGIFPENLKTLDLSINHLLSPSPDAISFIGELYLGRNNYVCDCSLKEFILWLQNSNSTQDKQELVCSFPENFLNVPLTSLTTEGCEAEDVAFVMKVQLVLFVGTTVLILLMLIGSVIFIRFRGSCFRIYKTAFNRLLGSPGSEGGQRDHQYDAYICFSNEDFSFVEAAFLKQLDSQFSKKNTFRVCFEARDFLPGEDHISNIRNAIWASKKTICVVTKEFLKDGWCIEAFNMAQSRLHDELKDVLIMILVGRIPRYQLKKFSPIRTFVQTRHYLLWPEDLQDMEWFHHRLAGLIFKEKTSKSKENVSEDVSLSAVKSDSAVP